MSNKSKTIPGRDMGVNADAVKKNLGGKGVPTPDLGANADAVKDNLKHQPGASTAKAPPATPMEAREGEKSRTGAGGPGGFAPQNTRSETKQHGRGH